ncbi:MAG: hypothetical protein ACREQ5_40505, partial [Candidatus Dormibacteria bacterium]
MRRLLRALLVVIVACVAALWAVPVQAAVTANTTTVVQGGTLTVSAGPGLDTPTKASFALWATPTGPAVQSLTPDITPVSTSITNATVTVPPTTPVGTYTLVVCNNPSPCA